MIATGQNGLVVELDHPRRLQPEDFLHLETVFNLLPKVILYVKDHTRRWVTCNRAALSLLRKQHQNEVLGAREEDFSRKPLQRRSRSMTCKSWSMVRKSSTGLN